MKKSLSYKLVASIIGILVTLDQITKYTIKGTMHLGQSIPVLGDFFKITYVENPGMAFGLRLGNPVLFMIFSIFAACLVFYYLYRMRNQNRLLQTALAFIASGAIGNLVDRFIYGRVVDFLDFEFFDISIPSFKLIGMSFSGYSMSRWPVFNVADMAVTCGMIIIISYLVFIGDPLKPVQQPSVEVSNGSNGNY